MILTKNQIITTQDGGNIKVLDLLGEGGQGEVYLVEYNSNKYALKIYIDEPSSDFIYNLKNNIKRSSPNDNFLWPKMFVNINDKHYGYLMDLRPSNYVTFVSYLTGQKKFKDSLTMIRWCLELCQSFKKLHENGFSYQDLNDGSFFFDPDSGDLLICDNDNVTADKKNLGVLGKMRYMAPEIVRGDKDGNGNPQMPDTHSDRFSLAVILFLTLCLGNPFEGERLRKYDIVDEDSEYEMFGTEPVFIYHKSDKSNRPFRGYHTSVIKRWPNMPIYIKEAFHRTFVDGLNDRENGRTTEIEWIKLLTKYRDEMIRCQCGNTFIYGFNEKQINTKCPYCNRETKQFCYLVVNKHLIALDLGKKLYKFHLDKYSSEYNEVVGTVISNPNKPSIWGIRLNLGDKVEIKDVNGNVRIVEGNGVIPLINNLKIKFADNVIGEIRTN